MSNAQQTPNVPENILQKIQKLQALAERAGTPEEAANAMSKITDMLTKYNIDMATVAAYKQVEKDDVVHEKHDLNQYQTDHDGSFAEKLINALSRFNFCRVVFNPGYKKDQGTFTIIGQKHNLEVVMYMYDYCLNNIKVMAAEGWKAYDGPTYKNKYIRGFYDGAVSAIIERLTIQKQEAIKVHGETLNALVLYNDKAVGEKTAELFPKLKQGSGWGKLDNSDAKAHGYAAGKKLNLAKGLDGGSRPKPMDKRIK